MPCTSVKESVAIGYTNVTPFIIYCAVLRRILQPDDLAFGARLYLAGNVQLNTAVRSQDVAQTHIHA